MNYRHAYHAGNFADCMKHALLLILLRAMLRKDKPFLVLDTHAGIGRYNLSSDAAVKTGEWQSGIGRLLAARPAALEDFLSLVERLGLYPGSPAMAAALLRDGDRLVCCELHSEDARVLKREFSGAPNVAVHERDGYAALKAFLPPPEKRGLILIDPPYEQEEEFARLKDALAMGYERFPAGVFAAWYPIKHRAPARDFFETLRLTKLRDVVTAAFWARPPLDPGRLNGCGLLVVNPPYGFETQAAPVLRALVESLGEPGAGSALERLIDE